MIPQIIQDLQRQLDEAMEADQDPFIRIALGRLYITVPARLDLAGPVVRYVTAIQRFRSCRFITG